MANNNMDSHSLYIKPQSTIIPQLLRFVITDMLPYFFSFLAKKHLARVYKRKILLHLINKELSAELSMHQINSVNG